LYFANTAYRLYIAFTGFDLSSYSSPKPEICRELPYQDADPVAAYLARLQEGGRAHPGRDGQPSRRDAANPAAVSVERLFRVLRVLQVDLQLTPSASDASESGVAGESVAPSPTAAPSAGRTISRRSAKTASPVAAGGVKHENQTQNKQKASAQTQEKAPGHTRSRNASTTAAKTPRAITKPRNASKKREDW
jgi:HTH-type transcriptional regulator / antitoxin HipB